MSNVTTYINESIEDLRQVRWPTRQQAVRFSAIVIGFTLVSAAFFGLVDFIFSIILKEILTLAA